MYVFFIIIKEQNLSLGGHKWTQINHRPVVHQDVAYLIHLKKKKNRDKDFTSKN